MIVSHWQNGHRETWATWVDAIHALERAGYTVDSTGSNRTCVWHDPKERAYDPHGVNACAEIREETT